MSAAALLAKKPRPTDGEIDAAMNGNLCRCATYLRIRQAIHRAAELQIEAPPAGRARTSGGQPTVAMVKLKLPTPLLMFPGTSSNAVSVAAKFRLLFSASAARSTVAMTATRASDR